MPQLLVNLLVLHDIPFVAGPDGMLPESETVRQHYRREVQAFLDYFQRRGGVDLLARYFAACGENQQAAGCLAALAYAAIAPRHVLGSLGVWRSGVSVNNWT